jgi:predicted nuclease with TOPRIM domain
MKNWKDIALVVTIILCLIFGWMTFFKGDSGYKERIKSLEKENAELQAKRATLDAEIARRKTAFDSLSVMDIQLQSQLAVLETETRLLRDEVKRSRGALDDIQTRIIATRKRIADLKKNPANRKDTDLINSLKLKTNQ